MFKLGYFASISPSVSVGVLNGSESLTPLGERVACMSCDPRLGKLLVLSSLFRCVLPMLSVAACLTRDPFHNSLQNRSAVNKVTHTSACLFMFALLTFTFCSDQCDTSHTHLYWFYQHKTFSIGLRFSNEPCKHFKTVEIIMSQWNVTLGFHSSCT